MWSLSAVLRKCSDSDSARKVRRRSRFMFSSTYHNVHVDSLAGTPDFRDAGSMATTCPIGLDVDQLRREVSFIYARVADDPSGDFHFHRGADYAASLLVYDATALAEIASNTSAALADIG